MVSLLDKIKSTEMSFEIIYVLAIQALLITDTRVSAQKEAPVVDNPFPTTISLPSFNMRVDITTKPNECYATTIKLSQLKNGEEEETWSFDIDREDCMKDKKLINFTMITPPQDYSMPCGVNVHGEHGTDWIIERKIPDVGEYIYYRSLSTWLDAYCICEARGMHLAVLNSFEEAKALTALINEIPPIANTFEQYAVYMGFQSMESPRTYYTVHGGTKQIDAGYSNWRKDGPSTFLNEDCGCMDRQGFLRSHECLDLLGFICEKPK